MKKNDSRRGFTLIELLVVVAIIGLLASIVIASLNTARQKGRDARRVADIKQLQLALEMYNDANGMYPAASSTATQPTVTPAVLATYIAAIPRDPTAAAAAGYYAYAALGASATACNGYHLGAILENTSNASLSSSAKAAAATRCDTTGAGAVWMTGVGVSTVANATDFSGNNATCVNTAAGTNACYDVKM